MGYKFQKMVTMLMKRSQKGTCGATDLILGRQTQLHSESRKGWIQPGHISSSCYEMVDQNAITIQWVWFGYQTKILLKSMNDRTHIFHPNCYQQILLEFLYHFLFVAPIPCSETATVALIFFNRMCACLSYFHCQTN